MDRRGLEACGAGLDGLGVAPNPWGIMASIILRPAVESDVPRLAELNGHLGYAAVPELVLQRLRRILASDLDCIRVAGFPDGRVAGWIHAQLCQWLESEYRAEIGGLIVDGTMRRQGVGRTLVREVARWAKARGAVELSVRCQIHRDDAHAFYATQGFALVKSQHVFRRRLD